MPFTIAWNEGIRNAKKRAPNQDSNPFLVPAAFFYSHENSFHELNCTSERGNEQTPLVTRLVLALGRFRHW
jgi:hypothetical protein